MPKKVYPEINKMYGHWKVLGAAKKVGYWRCLCTGCDQEKDTRSYDMRCGASTSCGCQKDILREKTTLEKYGVTSFTQSSRWKEKNRETNLTKRGVEYASQCPEVKKTRQQTCIQRYGSPEYLGSHESKEKRKATCQEKYGVDYYTETVEFREKTKAKMLDKYGVEYPAHSLELMQRARKTMLEKYGVEYPLQYAEFQTKAVNTTLQRFGVRHPCQDPVYAVQHYAKYFKHSKKVHWRTGKELICIASYEAKVVDYLNRQNIDFDWQPETFILSTGKTYRPDMYLVERDTWVEIKGYFFEGAYEKWIEFHKEIKPNSELWNESVLKEMGIL